MIFFYPKQRWWIYDEYDDDYDDDYDDGNGGDGGGDDDWIKILTDSTSRQFVLEDTMC